MWSPSRSKLAPHFTLSRERWEFSFSGASSKSYTCSESESVFPSGSLNQAILSRFGAVQIPKPSCLKNVALELDSLAWSCCTTSSIPFTCHPKNRVLRWSDRLHLYQPQHNPIRAHDNREAIVLDETQAEHSFVERSGLVAISDRNEPDDFCRSEHACPFLMNL
jgi:hypothetical protein